MNDFEKAVYLFGIDGAQGESGAIASYCKLISDFIDAGENSCNVKSVIENTKERIADELNHLLGNVADGIKLTGLKISADGLDEILETLKNAKAES